MEKKMVAIWVFSIFLISCRNEGKPSEGNEADNKEYPNIVLLLADDLGYGDPQCYNPDSQVPTPNIDQLAREGMLFTDAHTNSSVCTPTRYGIITGQYSWRGPLKKGVTWSYDSLIVDRKESTIASLLKSKGYRTAAVGKWHLGLGWQKENDSVRFDKPLTASPLDLGFDSFYGIAASLDIPPYVYLKDRNVVEQPTGFSEGTSKTYKDDFWRRGPVSPDFDHYQVLDHLTKEAERAIEENASSEKPFFLYFALTAPHLPWIPKQRFKGTSDAGNYGDLAAEVDGVVGRINEQLKNLGIDKETIFIFTSDNGSQFSSENMQKYGHRANGKWRGRKGDIYEGGNRVPFIVKWPGKISPASRSDQLVSTTDFYATFLDITETTLSEQKSKDSQSILPALLEESGSHDLRSTMVYHSAHGMFAIRDKEKVLIKGKGSGGFLEAEDTTNIKQAYQFYDLASDPMQSENLYKQGEEKTKGLLLKLQKIIDK